MLLFLIHTSCIGSS